jgi:hypothetical protein
MPMVLAMNSASEMATWSSISHGLRRSAIAAPIAVPATRSAPRSIEAGELTWIETKADIAAHQGASTRSQSATITESATASVVRAQCPPRAPVNSISAISRRRAEAASRSGEANPATRSLTAAPARARRRPYRA